MRNLALLMSVAFLGCGFVKIDPCSSVTCAGCCDSVGRCETGDSPLTCGLGGVMCSTCQAGEQCSQGACLGAGGGASGGAGGGLTGGSAGSGGGLSGGARGGVAGGGLAGGSGGGTSGGAVGAVGGATGGVGGGIGGGGGGGGGVFGGTTGGLVGGFAGGGGGVQPGEDCSSPTQLFFNADGIATYAADNTQYVNNGQGSCGDASDRVFQFDLSVPTWVSFSSSGLVAYHVRSVCQDPHREELCRTSSALEPLQAGPHFLWAEGAGAFTITLHRYMPTDRCINAEPLAFSSSGTASVTGSTLGYSNDSSACSAPGRDRVYSFATTRHQVFSATLSAAGFTPVLGLQTSGNCEQSSATACSTRADPDAQLDVQLPAGSHVLWLDAVQPTAVGTFDLRATLTDSTPGDYCDDPTRLGSPTAVVRGDTTEMRDDAAFCGGAGAPDVTFQFEQRARGPFSAVVMSPRNSPLLPVVDLVSGCTVTASTACGAGDAGVAYASRASLDAGTHFLHVDGLLGTSGPFVLATVQGIPDAGRAGDACSNAVTLPLGGLRAVALGGSTATAGLVANHLASCRRSGSTGAPDLVYRLDLPSAGTLNVTGVALHSSYELLLALQSAETCNASAGDLVCRVGGGGSAVTLTHSVSEAGRYWLWVSGWEPESRGPFHLLVAFR